MVVLDMENIIYDRFVVLIQREIDFLINNSGRNCYFFKINKNLYILFYIIKIIFRQVEI